MQALLHSLDASDRRLCWRLAAWRPPPWLRVWMLWSTRLGDGWLWVAVATVVLLRHSTRPAFGLVAAAALVANAAVVVLKGRVRRARPADRPTNTLLCGLASRMRFDEFSFPSGHALNAFALAAALGPAWPVAAPVLLFLAASIAASRVVLGVHFLTDVLAGSLIGSLLGSLCYLLLFGSRAAGHP